MMCSVVTAECWTEQNNGRGGSPRKGVPALAQICTTKIASASTPHELNGEKYTFTPLYFRNIYSLHRLKKIIILSSLTHFFVKFRLIVRKEKRSHQETRNFNNIVKYLLFFLIKAELIPQRSTIFRVW